MNAAIGAYVMWGFDVWPWAASLIGLCSFTVMGVCWDKLSEEDAGMWIVGTAVLVVLGYVPLLLFGPPVALIAAWVWAVRRVAARVRALRTPPDRYALLALQEVEQLAPTAQEAP